MKRLLIPLFLLLGATLAHSESIWTGNAGRGEISDFPESEGLYLAFSNSFPPHTRLEVTDPRTDTQVEVTVKGRLPYPGLLLLLDPASSETLGIEPRQVLPVRIKTIKENALVYQVEADEGALTKDTDYNPGAELGDLDYVQAPLPVEEPVIPEVEPPVLVEEEPPVIPEEIIEPYPEPELVLELEPEPVPEPEIIIEPYPEPELVFDQDLPEPEPEPEVPIEPYPEPELVSPLISLDEEPKEPEPEVLPPQEETLVYFLAPSDLRPPAGSMKKEVPPPAPAPPSPPPLPAVPMKEPSLALTSFGKVEPSRRYLQAGVFSDAKQLNAAASPLQELYPLAVNTLYKNGKELYRLLVGPLTSAETGVALLALASAGYPDAFPYRDPASP